MAPFASFPWLSSVCCLVSLSFLIRIPVPAAVLAAVPHAAMTVHVARDSNTASLVDGRGAERVASVIIERLEQVHNDR